jgi:hypothetical protein|tara:strand:+ start:6329 stop:6553 length:225 start_codon:yes stop_codon:yes gene_type:complete
LARLSELDAAPDAVEQLDRMPFFQRGNGRRCRRLRYVQGSRRRRHMLAFGNANEDAELLKSHNRTIGQSIMIDD